MGEMHIAGERDDVLDDECSCADTECCPRLKVMNSMMRRRRGWRCFFLGGIDGTWGKELAHILWVMGLFMGLEYRRPGEGLSAQCTAEWPFASVDPTMVLHVVPQFESLAAKFTLEGSIPRVRW